MKNLRPRRISSSISTLVARALATCLPALLFAFVAAAQVRPADAPPSPQQPQRQTVKQKDSPFDEDKDEGESESVPKEVVVRPRVTDPAAIMRTAHFIRVHSNSIFISGREVEDSLRKRKEFQAWGMVLTRNDGDADLVIEISRKPFTRRFTFTVLDPRTMEVVTTGKTRDVIFGKKIANKIAEKFANRVKLVRPYPPVAASNP
jgi:hypothetical protein